MAANQFPRCVNGNVEIHFSDSDDDDKYVLDSFVLALHSPWFKASLSERWSNPAAETSLINGKNYWIFELRFDKDSDLGMLVRKGTTTDTDTEILETTDYRDYDEFDDEDEYITNEDRRTVAQAHRDLFGMVYHKPPEVTEEDFEEIQPRINAISKTAQSYGCEQLVQVHLEKILNSFRGDIASDCLRSPLTMLELAINLQIPWIFREAAAHILGRSNRFYTNSWKTLQNLGVSDLFRRKRAEFEAQLQKYEGRIFRLPDGGNNHAALATAYFRKWLTDQLRANMGSGLAPGYAAVYHQIKKNRLSLTTDKAQRKRNVTAYLRLINGDEPTTDTAKKVDSALDGVISAAAAELRTILKTQTTAKDTRSELHRALTFMEVEDEELPWAEK